MQDPWPCINSFGLFLLLQGLETLSLHAQYHSENAMVLVRYLEQHPQIAWVQYLGLLNHESHELALKTLRPGVFSGMFSFGYKGDAQQTHRLVDNLKLVSNLANVRDAKTLVIHPAMMTHLQLTEEEQRETGVEHNALNHDIKEFKHKMIIVETEANNNEVKKAQLEAQLQEILIVSVLAQRSTPTKMGSL
ncbi:hypothetical protein H2248_011974 [Termitomyces sp. 'cryptogamus']|nr:hypothetical protein H2248_011974 [Termitomyces sp. 'cryptogamus']